jgi:hypothetical protein
VARSDLVEKQSVAAQQQGAGATQKAGENAAIDNDKKSTKKREAVKPSTAKNKKRISGKAPLISYVEWLRLPNGLRQLWIAEPNANHTISAQDIDAIQNKVLAGTRFVWSTTDPIASNTAAYFRGKIEYGPELLTPCSNLTHTEARTAAHDQVAAQLFRDLNARMKKEGLDKRVNLFLLPDPNTPSILVGLLQNPKYNNDNTKGNKRNKRNKQQQLSTASGKTKTIMDHPVVLAVPTSVKLVPRSRNIFVEAFRQVFLALPILTLLSFSVRSYALNPSFFTAIVKMHNARGLSVCAPIILGIVAIQAVHELAHWVIARRKGIRIGCPFPIPSFELGTFGCITALKSFPAVSYCIYGEKDK